MNHNNNLDNYLNSLNEIYNLSEEILNSKSTNDIFLEIKSEEQKLSSLFNTIEQTFKNNWGNMKNMQKKYENELSQMKDNYNKEINEL